MLIYATILYDDPVTPNKIKAMTYTFKRFIICSWLSLLFSPLLHADPVKQHTKIWTSVPITGSITADKKWNYYLEPQLRFIDDKYKFNHANLFVGAYYQATDSLSFWLGAFRNYTITLNGNSQQEFALWQQVVWKILDNNNLKLTSRSRFEERRNFRRPQLSNRFREKITAERPLNHSNKYFLVVADEVFFQLNQPPWVQQRVFS